MKTLLIATLLVAGCSTEPTVELYNFRLDKLVLMKAHAVERGLDGRFAHATIEIDGGPAAGLRIQFAIDDVDRGKAALGDGVKVVVRNERLPESCSDPHEWSGGAIWSHEGQDLKVTFDIECNVISNSRYQGIVHTGRF